MERETLHIMDGEQRVALVETQTAGQSQGPRQLIRYQHGNHLGSACVELDHIGEVISYEEYYPYGSTSYHAMNSKIKTPKRYRYSGKERDEESGLYYYGARYYAEWLGRWVSVDPIIILPINNRYSDQGNDVFKAEYTINYVTLLVRGNNEKDLSRYYQLSPYILSFCNPIKIVDLNGRENIVLIGDQGESPSSDKSTNFRGYRYQTNTRHFLEAGFHEALQLKKNETNNNERTIMMVYKGSYAESELNYYRKKAANAGILLFEVDSSKEISNYINFKNTRGGGVLIDIEELLYGVSHERKNDLVTDFSYIGHGGLYSLLPGRHQGIIFSDPLKTATFRERAFHVNADVHLNSCASGFKVMDDFVNRLVGGYVRGYRVTLQWGERGLGHYRPWHQKYYVPGDQRRTSTDRGKEPIQNRVRFERGNRAK
jgi:RHS repeat-associated protein